MSLQNLIGELQQSGGLAKLAGEFGMDPKTAESLAGMLVPTIGAATQKRMQSAGAANVLGHLRGDGQTRYLAAPETAAQPQAMSAGQSFLESILGSGDATQTLASEAAARTSAAPSQVASFLPALAAILQGAMQKHAPDTEIDQVLQGPPGGGNPLGGGLLGMVGGLLGTGSAPSGGGLSQLAGMLDADGDGSPMDDILRMVMR